MLKYIAGIVSCSIFLAIGLPAYGMELTSHEAEVLNQFFLTMLRDSEGGYVIFDSKPVCIHSFNANDDFFKETPQHLLSVRLQAGSKVLKNKKFTEDNLIIHAYNNNDSLVNNCIHLLFINKKLFLNSVKENLPLFQYVLGPEVTPEKLLAKLTDPEETFHNVLKEDRVLIGIILGFGAQNSLYVSRCETIQDHWYSDYPPLSRCVLKYPNMPLEYKKNVFLNIMHDTGDQIKPAFGYSSTEEEIKSTLKKIGCSSEKLVKDNPNFIFGHILDKTSMDLIEQLEQAQEKTIKLLASKEFLKDTLKLVYPKDNITLLTQNEQSIFSQRELKRLPFLAASTIWNNMEDEGKEYYEAMLEGMQAAESNKTITTFTEFGECEQQKKFQDIQKNVEEADGYLQILDKNYEYTKVSNQPLFYRILKEGNGNILQHPSEVLVTYSIAYLDGEIIVDFLKKKAQKVALNTTIPGFALGMKGMKVGEEREILIYPSMGYGIFTSVKKGVFLKVKVNLVGIIAGDNNDGKNFETNFAKDGLIDLKSELQNLGMQDNDKLADLIKSAGFTYGYRVWNHYKKGTFYSLERVMEQLENLTRINVYSELSREDESLLNHLHWVLYQNGN